MKKYIKIMRLDHWIKQLFILPGLVFAIFIFNTSLNIELFIKIILGFLGVSFIASSNYVINEYLDAKFDKYHPVKKNRSLVDSSINKYIVISMWLGLMVIGIVLGHFINYSFMIMQIFLWIMGIIYNVKPIRSKDIPILDVLSESINNAIRLLLGWFIISGNTLPPSSLIFGYWLVGAFLMNTKRYAEYKMIDDKKVASLYRKSFKFYTENTLIICSLFYAMTAIFFIGIFLIKYKIELLLLLPFLIGLFCYYFLLALRKNTAVQNPEKLYREKGLMIYCILLIILFIILLNVNIPILDNFTKNDIIKLW